MRFLRFALVLVVAMVMSACSSTPVMQDLTQAQANEIVAALADQGISAVAKKETGGRGMYSVQIRQDQYADAVMLLHEKNLPSEARPSVSELLAPQGIIPSSREMEALRLDYALAAQLEDVLQSHPSIAMARCVVRQNFLKEGQDPAVSLVVEERADVPQLSPDAIFGIVLSSIPGIKRENVTLALGNAPSAAAISDVTEGVIHEHGGARKFPLVKFLWFWRVPESEYTGLALLFSLALLLVGAAAAGLGYWTCLFHRTRGPVETNIPEIFPKSLRLDRIRKNLPDE